MAKRASTVAKKKSALKKKTKKRTTKKTARSRKTQTTKTHSGSKDVFGRLEAVARNLWWTWNPRAKRLFESLDPALWRATGHNPLKTINRLDTLRRQVLQEDTRFLSELAGVEKELREYLGCKAWFDRTVSGKQKKLQVAYYCMEYGLHESLPLYSGGLGILAADHLKSASDLGIPLVGVGILWRYGYYRQEITADGEVRILYPQTDFAEIAAVDTGKSVTIPIGRSKVTAKIWRVEIGRVTLFLLDTDHAKNTPKDRMLTHNLYGGDNEYRIRQEILLGVGGLHALKKVGIEPTVHHLNEGHAAFAALERVRLLVKSRTKLDAAIAEVRSSSVFTTHTPVPAGNDRFEPKLFNKYLKWYADDLKISNKELLAFGREDETDKTESFCMTVLALKLSERCNGVAELHGETSRGMWMRVFGAKEPVEVPIGHVTNGIHPETWIADEARSFYDKHLKPRWVGAGPEDDWWAQASSAPAEELWNLRQTLRRKLVAQLRLILREQYLSHQDDPELAHMLYETLDEDALTIGFARRFATYKRAPLIFRDPDRLARILGNADRPVQFIFAGKAHPRDAEGNEFVRIVAKHTRETPFRGRIFIVQNYDTSIGRMLTQGCDVWLNNPVRPMEASGTSGMKPPLNGGLNFSILDGWWPEGYNGKNGWAIGDGSARATRAEQDEVDAEAMYSVLEREIVPMFYKRNGQGIPVQWVERMGESMRSICCKFSTHRMLADYLREAYLPAHG
ncbi:MAG: alpha-glucan family phosphorylase [Phycisphaeraceae bacterium]|nr:MAG: alpha-glucan family phosphorylase [Phycisphaeraceae bacterium]